MREAKREKRKNETRGLQYAVYTSALSSAAVEGDSVRYNTARWQA